jgi:hypothetical protein
MTIKELKDLISSVPDNFIFEIEVEKKVSDEELAKRSYPYPFDTERCQVENGNYDIGWSDERMKLNIRIVEL